jgi:phage shock protein PspC (stress-responsive transcriptional regulator)
MYKRLYKSRHDHILDGVCAGVANYFNLDPSLVRLLWVGATFLGFSGVIAYIVCMIVIPREPSSMDMF